MGVCMSILCIRTRSLLVIIFVTCARYYPFKLVVYNMQERLHFRFVGL